MPSSAEQNAFDFLRQSAEKRWQRLLEHPEVSAREGSLGTLQELPQQRPEWFRVWGASEFVSEQCTRNPEMLAELLVSGALDLPGSAESTREYVSAQVAECPDEATLHQRLRRCRMREMVRIAWRDLGELSNLGETMACVSALADAAIEQALTHHDRWLAERFGCPRGTDGGRSHMVVLGLGKLGGKELNYSSDVDLLFAYSAGGSTQVSDAGQRQLDNHEYFLKLGRKLVSALEPVTADGFVFRTDLRLRPNGDSGPLVLSFSAMEHYYQTHGRTWERYALIKARVVAGDSSSGQELLSMLRPFVYRKYLDFGAFDAIREMKRLIEREMKHRQTLDNIKLGWGGIREVEFLVQCHQLIRGGREKSLQTGSLYVAMEALVAKGVLDSEDAKHLRASYEFLRNTEHRLQMVADRQTQQLPSSEQEKLRLAGSMWFATWWEFDAELDRRRTYVHDQFSKILAESEGEKDSEEQLLGNLIHGGLEDVEALSELQAMGLRSAESIPGLLRGFRGGRLYQAYSSIERDRIDRLLPMALETMKSHADASRSLSGFINVIEAIGRRTAYLSLLIENPVALSQLLRLCGASPWISNHIGNNPVVLDELLHPIVDIRNRSRSDLAVELDARLAQVEENDEEARMNTLREFHHAQVLRIAAADVSGVLDVDDVHGALTDLGEVLLQVVFGDAVRFASRKLGEPPGDAGVIAYGKFASRELGYYSDLDLVVCYREAGATQASAAEREYYYARAGRRFIHLVTTRTSSGVLYEIDMRLRPSGRSGTLVSSLDGFFDYQRSSAWTWEHQALVRARVVVGSDDFRGAFESQRREILCAERGLEALKADVVSMREKMIAANCQSTDELYDLKLDEGGIVDIEFLVQYWVLANAAAHPALTIPRGNVEILGALGKAGIISQQDADQLGACYREYLARSLELKLQGRPVLAGQDELADQRRYVSQVWSAAFDG